MLEPDITGMLRCLTPADHREVASFVGLPLPAADDKHSPDRTELSKLVESRRTALLGEGTGSSTLERNLDCLKGALDLNATEVNLITFRAMLRLHPGFEALAGKYVGLCADYVFCRKLARLFCVEPSEVVTALAPAGRLTQSGLMDVHRGILGPLDNRIRLAPGLISPLVLPARSPAELLRQLLPATRPARLRLSMYPHLRHEIRLLSHYLRSSVAQHVVGSNVLLYGRPGTGKTELAAALAASIQSPLYVSEPAPDDGWSLTPRDRVRALVELQRRVRATDEGLVLVDEAENLFPTAWSDSEKAASKATINQCLEANPTPTIWISNRVHGMDEAFLRRFDLVVHVTPLCTSAKCKLLRNQLPAGTLDARELHAFAARRELSPAMISRMARVIAACATADRRQAREDLYALSNQYLETLGATRLGASRTAAHLAHDPGLLNTDPPLATLIDAMQRAGSGARMLFHGLPGTGKTAFGKALAEQLDKPLLQRQASTLLSAFLGETEQNLRAMFDEARREDGVLLLDEADSFLRSRSEARQRWEVTQTNELLTQMESFEGILICTTNRRDDLDPAALRRFDIKVEFKPLRHEQRVLLIRQCCTVLGIRARSGEIHRCAGRLDGLTPGDAVPVLRRLRLLGEPPSLSTLLGGLEAECRCKPGVHAPIGFVR